MSVKFTVAEVGRQQLVRWMISVRIECSHRETGPTMIEEVLGGW
jgi:hypothetical protein